MSDTEFAICPYCTSWNEIKEIHQISGVITCFHCSVTFNYFSCITEECIEAYL